MNRKFTKRLMVLSRAAFVGVLVNTCLTDTLIAGGADKGVDVVLSSIRGENEPAWRVDEGTSYQSITVTGTITAADDNTTLPGVNVVLKGTATGTVADANGNYKLEIPSTDVVLVFSSIGYATQEILVGNQTTINVGLAPDITTLNEVVVIGYGTANKNDLTGAVSSIKADEIQKSAAITIDQALQGRIAGVQMTTNTGVPGGGTSIQIRGFSSINYSSEPIYVIDGIIVNSGTGTYTDNAFSALSPSDIESIDVLKDASAAAIYGAQGANGVIIITTRRGKEGRPRIMMEAQRSTQYIPHYLDMVDLREYAQHQNELYTMRGWGINDQFADPSVLSEGTNWQKEIFTPADMQNYNFNISGGNRETKYKIAGSYMDQEGISAGSGFKRLNVSANLDTDINSWMKGGVSFMFTNTNQVITITDWRLISDALRQAPAVPARNLDGTFAGPVDNGNPEDLINLSLSNPLALAELIDRGNEKTGGRGTIYLEINPTKWLNIRTEVAADVNLTQARTFLPAYKLGDRENVQIENTRTSDLSRFLVTRTFATAKHKFLDKHNVSMMLGFEANENGWSNLMAKRLGGSNQLKDINAGNEIGATNSGTTGRRSFVSYFTRLNYSYDDRYLLTATWRRDASSLLAPGHRWSAFPSASAAWRISGEPFFSVDQINNLKLRFGYGQVGNSNIPLFAYSANLSNVPTIWGTGHLSGNIPNPSVTWERNSSLNLGLNVGLFNDRVEIEADIYKKTTDNLLLAVTGPATSATAGGQGSLNPLIDNIGAMENKGIELSVNTVNVDRNGFQWRSNLVYTLNRNKVVDLHTASGMIDRRYQVGGTEYIVSRTQTGGSLGDFYGYKMIGRINSSNDLYDSERNLKIAIPGTTLDPVTGQVVVPTDGIHPVKGIWVGDLIWDDYNKDGIITEQDRQYLGSPLPKFTYGIGNTFSYKNFDLNIFLNGSYGNKVLNFLAISLEDPIELTTTQRAAMNYARLDLLDPEGPADDIDNVRVISGDSDLGRMSVNDINDNGSRLSSKFIEDGSYLRIQNVALSYNAPRSILSRARLNSLKVTLSARNLYTFTKYSGYDPEVGMLRDQYSNYSQDPTKNGIDVGRYPSPRIYSVSLSVGL